MSEDGHIAEIVRVHGWYAANVADADPPFVYTIGLTTTWDHPELIVFGLEPQDAYDVLAVIVAAIRAGDSYRVAGRYSGILQGDFKVGLRKVDETQHEVYLGYAMGHVRYMGRAASLTAMQVFLPDAAGRFPFDVGCDIDVHRAQPRLDVPLTPREIRKWRSKWGSGDCP